MEIEDPLLHDQFIHELLIPGPHLDRYWIRTFPKKLNERLKYTSDQPPCFGWGVHIIESPNWYAIASLMFVLVILSGILSVVYSIARKDVSAGFSIGAYCVAIVTLGVTVRYLKWQSEETATQG